MSGRLLTTGPVRGGGKSSGLTVKRRPSSWSGSEAGSELVPAFAVREFCACDGTNVNAAAASVQAAIASGTNLVMAEPPDARPSAADLKFLHHPQQIPLGTSNRKRH